MKWIAMSLDVARQLWVRVGPYLLIEIVMPGGTLLAVLMFLYRRRAAAKAMFATAARPLANRGLTPFRPGSDPGLSLVCPQ
jgi:hypothetical protein